MADNDDQKKELLEGVDLSDSGANSGDPSDRRKAFEGIEKSASPAYLSATMGAIESIEESLDKNAEKAEMKKYLLELKDILNWNEVSGEVHDELIEGLEENISSLSIDDVGKNISQKRQNQIGIITHRIKKYYERLGAAE